MTPIGCAVGPPITGQLNLEGIPVHGKPLQIAGKTQHLNLQWGEATCRASLIVIIGHESPPVLIGMNIMRLLRVRIDVTNSTATPAQPDHKPFISTPPKHRTFPPPAALCCYKPSTSPPKQRAWAVAITHGQARTSTFDRRKASLRLCPGCPRLPVDPKCGSSPCRPPPVPAHLSSTQQQQLKTLFQELSDIVSQEEDDLGCTPLLQHTIETEGPPLRQPYSSQNPAVRREEMAQVQQMLPSGVIRPSNSPWASPVVMAKKKDGSLWFCVDFRQLNTATVKDAHLIPRINDLLDALHGARWFSPLDLKSGYWQVPIQEQDKIKTAFCTSSGQLFEFNQVPFGLCNAPATFSILMDRVLAGLHWETCLFCLDNIIVFTATWEQHIDRLRQVFERLRHAKLKLGADKCTFAAREVSYLGHQVTEEGLLPDPSLLALSEKSAHLKMPRKFAPFWVSPGTTNSTLKILQPSPDHFTP